MKNKNNYFQRIMNKKMLTKVKIYFRIKIKFSKLMKM
jgi:hypothetical protein